MNVQCPHCRTLYRVDPSKVPAAGVRTRCQQCSGVFALSGAVAEAGPAARPPAALVGATAAAAERATVTASATPAAPAAAPEAPAAAPGPFGSRSPDARARRVARALVSDMVVYNPERRDRALAAGTLRAEFKEEILKSWKEYVEQVGEELARGTPHFRNALNDLLAKGGKVF